MKLKAGSWSFTSYLIIISLVGLQACGGGGGGTAPASWSGTKQLGVTGTLGESVATDTSGNVYVTGQTEGDFDGNTLIGFVDFYITKYNSSGIKQYTRQFGAAGSNTTGFSIATDASGNVYVAGQTDGGLDGNTLTGITDLFVAKYNSSGIKQFIRQLGVSGSNTSSYSIATDTSGNVYVAGETNGNLDGNTLAGTKDFFITKYNSSGVKQFTRQLGVALADTIGRGITTDVSGNIYIAGYTFGDLDGNTLTGTRDLFVTKYNSSGVKQFTRQLGVVGANATGVSVITDSSDNIYVAGDTNGNLDGNTLTGTNDHFFTKYNSSGVKQFTRQLGVTGANTTGTSVTADSNGNIYVAGYTNGDLDGNTLAGTRDLFVTKYNSSGVKQFTRQLGVAGATTTGRSIASDVGGNVYVAGDTNGNLDGNTLMGNTGFFVTKYNSNGVKQ